MKVGIVGHEASKFTEAGEAEARAIIRELLCLGEVTHLVSGGCHLGGIDIWAEEIARDLGLALQIFLPKTRSWDGYKGRNIEIATHSDEIHCLAVARLASSYRGPMLECYHCNMTDHVKGGGCWTMKYAWKLGKPTQLHRIRNTEVLGGNRQATFK